MKIISGNSNLALAKKITEKLKLTLVDVTFKPFANKELIISCMENFKDEKILIIQSINNPNDLFELLLILDLVKRQNPKEITILIPYLGYCRQDKEVNNSSNAPLVIARILETSGINKIITVDIHSLNIMNYYKIPFININPCKIFENLIESDFLIIAPDYGSYNKYKIIFPSIIPMKKIRSEGEIKNMELTTNINLTGKTCFIIDDIVDSGDTLIRAANILKQKDVKNIYAFATHACLSGNAIDKIIASSIDKIYVSNSIPQDFTHNKFTILDLSELLIEYIIRS